MVWFHCFAYGCPAFPIPLIEETAFLPIVCSLLLCHKLIYINIYILIIYIIYYIIIYIIINNILIIHIYVGISWALNSVTLICVYFSANVMLF